MFNGMQGSSVKRIGIDVGNTFTDLILVDEEAGKITVDKIPSTPDDPARGVVEGITRLSQKAGVQLSEVDNPTCASGRSGVEVVGERLCRRGGDHFLLDGRHQRRDILR